MKSPGSACIIIHITAWHSCLCRVSEEVRQGERLCSKVTGACLSACQYNYVYHSMTFLPSPSPWGGQTRWVWLKEVTRVFLSACQDNYVYHNTIFQASLSPWGGQTRWGLSLQWSHQGLPVSTCTLQYNIPTFVKSMRRSDKVRIVSAVKLPGSACQYMYITVQHSYLCQVNEEVRLGECHCSEVTRDCLCRNAYHIPAIVKSMRKSDKVSVTERSHQALPDSMSV